jgi:DHA1 family bicyclomycin/chloramphenicol resistance-like MFS transporter
VLPIAVYCVGTSVVMPSATLILLDLFPTMRGMASSLQGFINFALSAVNAGTVSPLLAHSLPTLALGMLAFTAASFALWLVYQRRALAHLKGWQP